MSLTTGISLATVLLTLAMDTAQADYTVTQADCQNVNYSELAKQYEGKMKAAVLEGNQTLLGQAERDHKAAQDNEAACKTFAKSHPPTPVPAISPNSVPR